jgi:hypothetical protein
MLKTLMLLGLVITMAVGVLGCDELTKGLSGDAARMISDASGNLGGDVLMTQLRLRDGSCDGTCDGVPNPDAGGWQGSQGAGGANGAGDQLRLRDGSCEQ